MRSDVGRRPSSRLQAVRQRSAADRPDLHQRSDRDRSDERLARNWNTRSRAGFRTRLRRHILGALRESPVDHGETGSQVSGANGVRCPGTDVLVKAAEGIANSTGYPPGRAQLHGPMPSYAGPLETTLAVCRFKDRTTLNCH